MATLAEKIDLLENSFNEIAFGWNDSGSFWHLTYGNRGAGSMIEGCGKSLSALEADGFEQAVDYFLAELGLLGKEPSAEGEAKGGPSSRT